jgi:hypothetical protein
VWRSKKLIFIEVLIIVTLVATVGLVGVAYANNSNNNQSNNTTTSLMQKIADIYKANTGTTIDPQELEKAFTQARQEMRTEALDNFLQKLVQEGKITQQQADDFKAWLNARPDIPALGKGGMMPFGGMHRGGGFGFRMGSCPPSTNNTK